MTSETIVRMANQIASFFRSRPSAEAVAATADHIRKFWDPRMRAQLLAHLAGGGEGLTGIAHEAAQALAAVNDVRPTPTHPGPTAGVAPR